MTDADQVPRPPAEAGPGGLAGYISRGRAVTYSLAILSLAAAVIHFAVAGEHFQEYWVFGVFMLGAAWLQLAWAILAAVRPVRLLLWSGIVLNAGVVAVYIVTRTVGDVIGPTPHEVEPLGFGDGFCTVLEALIVAGCAWLLFASARQQHKPSLTLAPVFTGGVTAALLSVALVAGGPEMVMSGDSDMAAAPALARSPARAWPGWPGQRPAGDRARCPAPRRRSGCPLARPPGTSLCRTRTCRWLVA